MTPPGDWSNWLNLAGRGWGKTRTGAEDVAYYGQSYKKSRIAVVAPTYADARDTCIEGESGLLACLPEESIRDWNRSLGELWLRNGTLYKLYSSEKPNRLRGPQHHRSWCDEIGAWKYPDDTWDMLQFGLRLGELPQNVITSTPRPIKVVRNLVKDPNTIISSGSTYENQANLPKSFFEKIIAKYEGTRLGLQELYAKLLEDFPGALWQRVQIEKDRNRDESPDDVARRCKRIVVAIDPSVTSGDDSDETGIVAAGMDGENRGYVLADESVRESPAMWAKRAVELFKRFGADLVIAETNNGGDLVEETLRHADPNIPFKKVTASRGKYVRAEPISLLYEQGRISHVGMFETLEDQMCLFTPDNINKISPDRVDALVWAFSDLFSGMMSLGLLGLVRKMKQDGTLPGKVERHGGLIKPALPQDLPGCPECGSVAINRIGNTQHCNQCGTNFNDQELVKSLLGGGRKGTSSRYVN